MTFRTLTVVTPAASQHLTLLSTVKRAMGITVTDHDTFLTESIARASGAIASYCGRVFGMETVEERIWLNACQPVINLKRYPNITIDSITESDAAIGALNTDYFLNDASGQLIRLSAGSPYHWSAEGWIVITYEAGYELLDALPFDIEDACISLVKMAYSTKGQNPLLKSESVVGVGSQEYRTNSSSSGVDLPDDVRALLNPFRNIAT